MGKRPAASALLAIPLNHASETPLFRQLYEGVRSAILSGQLPAGTRLPSSRTLANELQVSRNTVLTSFEQLLVEGYLDGKVGAGTYVASKLPDRSHHDKPRLKPLPVQERRLSKQGMHLANARVEAGLTHSGPMPFCPALPAVDAFPAELWGRLMARRWRRSHTQLLGYGQSAGYRPLREAVASYLGAARAVRCTADQVIIVSGSQQALDIAARVLLDVGDDCWIEDPGYLGAREALLGVGATVVPVPVDAEGLDVARGIELSPNARLVFVSPSHQYPLGVTMSLARRLALLQWAKTTGAWIIEDDYDSEYRYNSRPLASLQGLDTDRQVIYMGTFSKVVFPSLRLGYLVVPADVVEHFVAARGVADRHAPLLEQAVLTDFISEGHFTTHIRRMRDLYGERCAALAGFAQKHLAEQLLVPTAEAGMHVVGWLQAKQDDEAVFEAASRVGVEAIPLSAYRMEGQGPPGLVLGFACQTPQQLEKGIMKLAGALHSVSE